MVHSSLSTKAINSAQDSVAEANRELRELMAAERLRSLWFLNAEAELDITQPETEAILKAILRSGNRQTWRRARKLLAWRSQHSK